MSATLTVPSSSVAVVPSPPRRRSAQTQQQQPKILECRVLNDNSTSDSIDAVSNGSDRSSPQAEYVRALNFESEQPKIYVNGRPANDADGDKVKNMMSGFMQKINNSNYLYPGIALMIATLLLIIIIFQTTTFISKVLATVIYALFVCVTVYQNMGQR